MRGIEAAGSTYLAIIWDSKVTFAQLPLFVALWVSRITGASIGDSTCSIRKPLSVDGACVAFGHCFVVPSLLIFRCVRLFGGIGIPI